MIVKIAADVTTQAKDNILADCAKWGIPSDALICPGSTWDVWVQL